VASKKKTPMGWGAGQIEPAYQNIESGGKMPASAARFDGGPTPAGWWVTTEPVSCP